MSTPQPPPEPPESARPGPVDPWIDAPTPFDAVSLTPLGEQDPPKVGNYWLDARLDATPAGVAFTGHDGAGQGAMVVLLSEGAAADAAARDRLAGVVNALHIDAVLARGGHGQDFGRMARKFRPEDDPVAPDDRQPAPWVALIYDGSPAAAAEARRILHEVDLAYLPPQGRPAGPDYQHYWVERVQPGLARLWPLPWPGRYDRAGWRTIFVSWLLMLLLAALAVLIAILIFRNQPPQAPPPPTGSGSPPPQSSSPSPQSGSPSPQSGSPSGSPSSQSGSPSPESGSPSPESGSPSPESGSPSGSPSESGSGSPSPSGTQSGGGDPTPSDSGTANTTPSPGSRL